jgi:DnaK suppressor protein
MAGKVQKKSAAKTGMPTKTGKKAESAPEINPKIGSAAKPNAEKTRKPMEGSGFDRNEQIRKILARKRADIINETREEIKKYVTGENRQLVETALDEGDLSVVDLAEDLNLRKLSVHRETLGKIDVAFGKLDEGTYGICDECGDEISAQRLMIMPFAVLCRDCQEEREIREKIERENAAQ